MYSRRMQGLVWCGKINYTYFQKSTQCRANPSSTSTLFSCPNMTGAIRIISRKVRAKKDRKE